MSTTDSQGVTPGSLMDNAIDRQSFCMSKCIVMVTLIIVVILMFYYVYNYKRDMLYSSFKKTCRCLKQTRACNYNEPLRRSPNELSRIMMGLN